jgi:ATP-dependent RNA helicase DDX23/PRP28
LKQEEETKKAEEERFKALQASRSVLTSNPERRRDDHRYERRRSRSREDDYKSRHWHKSDRQHHRNEPEKVPPKVLEKQDNFLIDKKEVQMIKEKYLGLNKDIKKKPIRTGDKFRQVFTEDWDANDDTSKDVNPLYAMRRDPKLLFGKGFVAGVDHEAQNGGANHARMDTVSRNFNQH